jgi:dTDP-4-dehydrorhamnose 3,5-epimerase
MDTTSSRAAPKVGTSSGAQSANHFDIEGPILITTRRFTDARGFFAETYNEKDFAALGVLDRFVQDNVSLSVSKGTIRGMHFQLPPHAQAKLVRVQRGSILDVAVDIRRSSSTYGRYVAVRLDEGSGTQFYVPVGFAHGFCTLEPNTEVTYKVTEFYFPEFDRGVVWNDPDLALPWPITEIEAVVSEKDCAAPRLRDLPFCFD